MSFILLGILNSQAVGGAAGVGVAGYAAGGQSGNTVTTVDKFAFPDDTRSTLATGLSVARKTIGGFSNVGVAGYAAGGLDAASGGSRTTTVDKFTFPSDSRSTLATGLSIANQGSAGFNDAGVAGYNAGGQPSSNTSVVDKFAFPGDSRSTLATGLSSARTYLAGMFDTGVAGYAGSGTPSGGVDKFAFPSDSRTTLAIGLPASDGADGFSNPGTAGYVALGSSTTVYKFAFPSDTRTILATGLSTQLDFLGATFSNPNEAGYLAPGESGGSLVTTVDKFDFPDDTRSTLATGLSAGRQAGMAGMQDA